MRDPQAGSLSAVPSFSPLVRCPAARPPHAPWRRHEGPDDMILAGGDGVVGWGLGTRPALNPNCLAGHVSAALAEPAQYLPPLRPVLVRGRPAERNVVPVPTFLVFSLQPYLSLEFATNSILFKKKRQHQGLLLSY
jgi:hypothetical protein